MISIAWPWFFILLPLPVLVYRFSPPAQSFRVALRIPFYRRLTGVRGVKSGSKPRLTLLLMCACWLLLVAAAIRPQWTESSRSIPASGRDLMMAVDVSGSMKALDMIYNNSIENRLTTVKRVAGEFIERRRGDRIGLILFGTRAYLQAPLSLDGITVNQLLQEAAIGIAGEKTAIGDAIGLALKRVKERAGNDKVLILLTDGANTAGQIDPLQAANLASLAGLKIHTIGVGGDENSGRLTRQFYLNRSELDEKSLVDIAQQTGGQYFRATDAQSLAEIYTLIDQLEPLERDDDQVKPVHDLYYWPLGAALLLSMLLAARFALHREIGRFAAKTSRTADRAAAGLT